MIHEDLLISSILNLPCKIRAKSRTTKDFPFIMPRKENWCQQLLMEDFASYNQSIFEVFPSSTKVYR